MQPGTGQLKGNSLSEAEGLRGTGTSEDAMLQIGRKSQQGGVSFRGKEPGSKRRRRSGGFAGGGFAGGVHLPRRLEMDMEAEESPGMGILMAKVTEILGEKEGVEGRGRLCFEAVQSCTNNFSFTIHECVQNI